MDRPAGQVIWGECVEPALRALTSPRWELWLYTVSAAAMGFALGLAIVLAATRNRPARRSEWPRPPRERSPGV